MRALRWLLLLSPACAPPAPPSPPPLPTTTAPLAQEAFVWQQQWTPAVSAAVAAHGESFGGLTVLRAEVGWAQDRPAPRWIEPDRAVLQALSTEVGFAIRVLPYTGPDPEPAGTALAALVAEILSRDPWVREIHVDFDAESHALAAYADWLARLRPVVGAERRLTITALPDWLHREGFDAVVAAVDRYALQVHWLAPPRLLGEPLSLMDADNTRDWVVSAARLGAPFHVALPTYGYRVAYDPRSGEAIGVIAESGRAGGGPLWREVRADPAAIAPLLAAWSQGHPAALQGVSWYRLPVEGDTLNWRWVTLDAVRHGRTPEAVLEVRVVEASAAAAAGSGAGFLVDVWLHNTGEAGAPVSSVAVRWPSAVTLVAADGLGGLRWDGDARRFVVPEGMPAWLEAGEARVVGWLRLSEAAQVRAVSSPATD